MLPWTLAPRRDSRVTCAVLRAAARRVQRVIFHSDRGLEYIAAPFHACVTTLGLGQRASARGSEGDAHMESFFHSLKPELTLGIHSAMCAFSECSSSGICRNTPRPVCIQPWAIARLLLSKGVWHNSIPAYESEARSRAN